MNKVMIITAPSGSGKTSIIKKVLEQTNDLEFSISACTRSPRGVEVDGKDYYFIDLEKFQKHIEDDSFVEFEMVYPGKYYGTLKSELERIWAHGKTPLLDLDVIGAANFKERYPDNTIAIFIKPPSLEVLESRLIGRGTETPESLIERVEKAKIEVEYESKFDFSITNHVLSESVAEAIKIIESQIKDLNVYN